MRFRFREVLESTAMRRNLPCIFFAVLLINGILNYCRTKVRFGVVEAINGNIRMLINRADAAIRTCATYY